MTEEEKKEIIDNITADAKTISQLIPEDNPADNDIIELNAGRYTSLDKLPISLKVNEELSDIDERILILNESLKNKVDKEGGKELSTNDFTNEYKSKIDNSYRKGETDDLLNEKADKQDVYTKKDIDLSLSQKVNLNSSHVCTINIRPGNYWARVIGLKAGQYSYEIDMDLQQYVGSHCETIWITGRADTGAVLDAYSRISSGTFRYKPASINSGIIDIYVKCPEGGYPLNYYPRIAKVSGSSRVDDRIIYYNNDNSVPFSDIENTTKPIFPFWNQGTDFNPSAALGVSITAADITAGFKNVNNLVDYNDVIFNLNGLSLPGDFRFNAVAKNGSYFSTSAIYRFSFSENVPGFSLYQGNSPTLLFNYAEELRYDDILTAVPPQVAGDSWLLTLSRQEPDLADKVNLTAEVIKKTPKFNGWGKIANIGNAHTTLSVTISTYPLTVNEELHFQYSPPQISAYCLKERGYFKLDAEGNLYVKCQNSYYPYTYSFRKSLGQNITFYDTIETFTEDQVTGFIDVTPIAVNLDYVQNGPALVQNRQITVEEAEYFHRDFNQYGSGKSWLNARPGNVEFNNRNSAGESVNFARFNTGNVEFGSQRKDGSGYGTAYINSGRIEGHNYNYNMDREYQYIGIFDGRIQGFEWDYNKNVPENWLGLNRNNIKILGVSVPDNVSNSQYFNAFSFDDQEDFYLQRGRGNWGVQKYFEVKSDYPHNGLVLQGFDRENPDYPDGFGFNVLSLNNYGFYINGYDRKTSRTNNILSIYNGSLGLYETDFETGQQYNIFNATPYGLLSYCRKSGENFSNFTYSPVYATSDEFRVQRIDNKDGYIYNPILIDSNGAITCETLLIKNNAPYFYNYLNIKNGEFKFGVAENPEEGLKWLLDTSKQRTIIGSERLICPIQNTAIDSSNMPNNSVTFNYGANGINFQIRHADGTIKTATIPYN